MLLPQTIIPTDNICTKCDKPLTLQVTTELRTDLPGFESLGEVKFTVAATVVSCLLCGQKYPAGATSTG